MMNTTALPLNTAEALNLGCYCRTLSTDNDVADNDAFLAASWAVLRAERQCDELLRHARRTILHAIDDAPSLMLANDLAMTLELASDRLLAAGYALRELVFNQTGVKP